MRVLFDTDTDQAADYVMWIKLDKGKTVEADGRCSRLEGSSDLRSRRSGRLKVWASGRATSRTVDEPTTSMTRRARESRGQRPEELGSESKAIFLSDGGLCDILWASVAEVHMSEDKV